MKYKVVSVSFDIEPVDLTEQEVSLVHSHICDEVRSKEWDAEDPDDLCLQIANTFKYPLSSIIFTPSLADETYNFYQDGWTCWAKT